MKRPRLSKAARLKSLLTGLAALASGCTAGSHITERFPASDLLRDPNGFVGAREIPPGTREEQMQGLADTVREAVGHDWTAAGTSLAVDGESLVVRADSTVLEQVGLVLAEMRRFR